MSKVFQYKKIRPASRQLDDLNRTPGDSKEEQLTGFVNGQAATDIEERVARALGKVTDISGWEFQPSVSAGRNMPGELRPDFLVYAGTIIPIQVDGGFAHKTAEQKQEDKIKDALLFDVLRDMGAMPAVRIPGYLLVDQADVDRMISDLIRYGESPI